MPPDSNGTGTLRIYNVDDNTDLGAIGTVNYSSGIMSITGITPVGYPANQFEIIITASAQEDSYNISSARNQIIVVDDSTENLSSSRLPGITINVTAV